MPAANAIPPTAPMAIQMPPWISIGVKTSFGSGTRCRERMGIKAHDAAAPANAPTACRPQADDRTSPQVAARETSREAHRQGRHGAQDRKRKRRIGEVGGPLRFPRGLHRTHSHDFNVISSRPEETIGHFPGDPGDESRQHPAARAIIQTRRRAARRARRRNKRRLRSRSFRLSPARVRFWLR